MVEILIENEGFENENISTADLKARIVNLTFFGMQVPAIIEFKPLGDDKNKYTVILPDDLTANSLVSKAHKTGRIDLRDYGHVTFLNVADFNRTEIEHARSNIKKQYPFLSLPLFA